MPASAHQIAKERDTRATASWDIKEWDTQDTRPSITDFQEDVPTQEMNLEHLPSESTGKITTRLARLAQEIMAEIDARAEPGESERAALRRRITGLIERAGDLDARGERERAAVALELAYAEAPDSALAHKLLSLNEPTIISVLERYLGDLDAAPRVDLGPNQLTYENIDPRAAFLLSRVDGTLSINEVLDIAGMGRGHALRYSAALVLRGILILPE